MGYHMLIVITFLSSKYKHVFLFLNLYTNFPGFKNLGGVFVSSTKETQLSMLSSQSWSRLSLNTQLPDKNFSRGRVVLTSSLKLATGDLTKHLPQNINLQITLRKFNFVDHLIREMLTFTADFVNYSLTNISYFLRMFSKFLHESNFSFAKINKKFSYELTHFLIMFILHHRQM